MKPVKAAILTYLDVNDRAAELLKQNGRLDEVPVDVEALVEIDLGLSIVPQRGLLSQYSIDGIMTLDASTFIVDQHVLERQWPRYRFTLAHELGHLVLHSDIIGGLGIGSEEEWIEFYLSLSEREHSWFEHQAYWFAGALLLPEDSLLAEFRTAIGKVEGEDLSLAQLSDYSRSAVAGAIARRFEVSTGAVQRRLGKLGLW